MVFHLGFRCSTGVTFYPGEDYLTCYPDSWLCDGISDCIDASDENVTECECKNHWQLHSLTLISCQSNHEIKKAKRFLCSCSCFSLVHCVSPCEGERLIYPVNGCGSSALWG